MRYDFTIRIYKDEVNNPVLSGIQQLQVSGITLVSKQEKFGGVCLHLSNSKRMGYRLQLSKRFNPVSGSHSTPLLTFYGKFIDVKVENFPRFPVFYQDQYAARNAMKGYGYTNYLNDGFPHQLLYRKIEFRNIIPHKQ